MTTPNDQTTGQLTVGASAFGRLGGQLGVLLCLIGFGAIFLGWNGAAGKNTIMAQFPFLISGGLVGLAIVVIGAAMLVVQNAREDRARLEAVLGRIAAATEAAGGAAGARSGYAPMGGGGALVLAGGSSYHRLDCTLTEARDEAYVVGLEEALSRQMEPCRVCKPPALAPRAFA
jgi:hypothetical protein